MSAKLDRCLRLVEAFIARGDLATRDVAEILDVDKQTAARDIRSLRNAGFPIDSVGEGSSLRHRLDAGYRRTQFRASQGDAFALCFGRQLLSFLDDTLVAEWHDALESKVGLALPDRVRQRDQLLHQRLLYLSEPYRPYGPHDETLNQLITSLLRSERVSMTYEAATVKQWTDMEPLCLVMYRRALYLLARFSGHPKVFRLAVDRIVDVASTGARFEYPQDFDGMAELNRGFGITTTGGQPEQVCLRFSPRVAALIRGRVWHSTQSIVELDDGRVELRFLAEGSELVRLALEFGETVEVVSPPWLRDRVRSELENALAQYG